MLSQCRERSASSYKADIESLTACALVGLAVFPLVGSALALFVPMPRRVGQAIVLVVFAGLAAFGWGRLYDGRMLIRGETGRRLIYAALISMGLVAALAVAGMDSGTWPSLYAIFSAMVVPVWLVLAILNLIGWKAIPESAERLPRLQGFNQFVFTLLAALALIAYFKGPQQGDVLMAFGGSTTVAGSNAAILGGLALATLSGWYRPAGLPLAMYLSLLAGSRAGLLLFVVLSGAILLVRSTDLKEGWGRGRRLSQDVVLLVLCAAIVVLPVRFSTFYPYFASRPGEAGIRVANRDAMMTQWEAFEWRYGRLLRLINKEVAPVDSATTDNSPTTVPGTLEGLRRADNRWELVLDTLKVVAANPRGYWPRGFGEVAQVPCGGPIRGLPPFCAYPHNLLLEIGFHFGWIPLGLMAAGLFVWGIRVLKTLTHHVLPVRVAAIAFLGYLLFAQVSGNLLDHLIAAGFGIFWMATQVLPRRQLGENIGTMVPRVGEGLA